MRPVFNLTIMFLIYASFDRFKDLITHADIKLQKKTFKIKFLDDFSFFKNLECVVCVAVFSSDRIFKHVRILLLILILLRSTNKCTSRRSCTIHIFIKLYGRLDSIYRKALRNLINLLFLRFQIFLDLQGHGSSHLEG